MPVSDSERIVYVFDEYRLDKDLRMLYHGGEEIQLPPKAVETLIALVEMRGEIVGKDDLIRTIWADTVVEESNLTHHIHVLRKELGNGTDGRPLIETLRRRGYRFNAEVTLVKLKGNGFPLQFADKSPVVGLVGEGAKDPAERLPDAVTLPVAGSSLRSKVILSLSIVSFVAIAASLSYFLRPAAPATSVEVLSEVSSVRLTSGDSILTATISPDGKSFVYHETADGKTHLWLQQTGQRSRIELIDPTDDIISSKTFSPDGEHIFYVGQEKGMAESCLFRLPTFGGSVSKILCNIFSPVSFSPDGREMVFIRKPVTGGDHLVATTSAGEKERVLLSLPAGKSFSLGAAWSPDGSRIAYAEFAENNPNKEGACSIKQLDVRSHVVTDLASEPWDTCFRMAWTNGGEGVVLVGTRSGESYTSRRDQVYYISAGDGRSRRISSEGGRFQAGSLGVTRNNEVFAVATTRLSQIWSMDANGDPRTAVQLTNGPSDGAAGVAPLPDGRVGYISRIGDELSIWVTNADGTSKRQISNAFPFIEELRATPDGRFFVFSVRREGYSHLYRIQPDGKNLTPITSGNSYEIDSAISPDGQWVYYGSSVSDADVWKTYLRKTLIEHGGTVELGETKTSRFVPSVSPDGKLLLVATDDRVLLISSDDGRVLETVKTDDQVQLSTGVKWTPDGRNLTFLAYRENSVNVWMRPFDQTEVTRLTDFPKGYIYFHAFSADGKQMYIARGYQSHDAVLIKLF